MDRWWVARRRRAEPAAIDITWVSCRGVRSSVPFHTPCLYASIYLHHPSPSSSSSHGGRRHHHRVKTATDRTGGSNPEWDAPLRLYLSSSSPASDGKGEEEEEEVLVRFELKSEVAVLGDVLTATAAVPVAELVADGRTRRVSYQLVGNDGKHPNGVISFSYAFHVGGGADDDRSTCTTSSSSSSCRDGGELFTPPTASREIALPAPTMYPVIDWSPTEQVIPLLLYPPPAKDRATTTAVKGSSCYAYGYPPPPPMTPPVEPFAVFPPPSPACGGVYPPTATTVREPVSSGGLYPRVDLDPVSCCYPPPTATLYGAGGCGYAAAPEWDGRCLHG
uniref:C2 domain-containing protein n=1 Tax=Leersia perrieri TaxID=77586 RepID=A0A0D9VGH0_9ORYZ